MLGLLERNPLLQLSFGALALGWIFLVLVLGKDPEIVQKTRWLPACFFVLAAFVGFAHGWSDEERRPTQYKVASVSLGSLFLYALMFVAGPLASTGGEA